MLAERAASIVTIPRGRRAGLQTSARARPAPRRHRPRARRILTGALTWASPRSRTLRGEPRSRLPRRPIGPPRGLPRRPQLPRPRGGHRRRPRPQPRPTRLRSRPAPIQRRGRPRARCLALARTRMRGSLAQLLQRHGLAAPRTRRRRIRLRPLRPGSSRSRRRPRLLVRTRSSCPRRRRGRRQSTPLGAAGPMGRMRATRPPQRGRGKPLPRARRALLSSRLASCRTRPIARPLDRRTSWPASTQRLSGSGRLCTALAARTP